VKAPPQVTHRRQLAGTAELLDWFLAEAGELGEKLGPVMVQLPPNLPLAAGVAGRFFGVLRRRFDGDVICEPRPPSWFTPKAADPLDDARVARAAPDPAVVPDAAEPGGWQGLVYYRLHGSPQMHYSAYPADYLDALARRVAERARSAAVWCIFDNTAEGAATADTLDLLGRITARRLPGGGDGGWAAPSAGWCIARGRRSPTLPRHSPKDPAPLRTPRFHPRSYEHGPAGGCGSGQSARRSAAGVARDLLARERRHQASRRRLAPAPRWRSSAGLRAGVLRRPRTLLPIDKPLFLSLDTNSLLRPYDRARRVLAAGGTAWERQRAQKARDRAARELRRRGVGL
jgi:Protein of unknown function DUF72